jgi:addiction module HigA family antidote
MPKAILSPGELLQAILKKHNLNYAILAEELGCSQAAVRSITLDKGQITVPLAMRLAKFFNTPPEYWLVYQMKYNLSEAAKDKTINAALRGISTVRKLDEKRKTQKTVIRKETAVSKKTAKKKETLADKRKKAGKAPGAKPAARNPKTARKPKTIGKTR